MSSIAVLAKAFSVVEVLARADRALSLAELCEESRLPKPTLHRILRSLRDLGYVDQSGLGEAYELSPRLISLREHSRDDAIRQKALPLMRRLHAAFDETVNLGQLEGVYVRYVHVIETTQALRWIVKPGARDAFETTALGRAIVAGLPAEQQARLVAKAAGTGSAATRKAARDRLQLELDTTSARGLALEEEETVAGVACIAIPLTCVGEPLAAVSVSVPVNRLSASRRNAFMNALRQVRDNPDAVYAQNLVNA
ncbi:MAG: IclR family transcriptional regulator [Undibacterium sp.]|nr:IclR family transcriptional regulator [Opitutaceae bacterium]